MTTIHMETEATKSLANQLHLNSLRLHEIQSSLRGQVSGLPYHWQGDDAYYFVQEAESNIRGLQCQIDALQHLSSLLNREIEQWIQADMDGCRQIGSIGLGGPWDGFSFDGLPTFMAGAGIGAAIGTLPWFGQDFDWFNWHLTNADKGFSVADYFLKNQTYEWYKSIGRDINGWIDDPRGGWVGSMDDAGHFIRTNPFYKFASDVGLPIAFDYLGGLTEGESQQQAILSAGLTTAATLGLKLIPGVGTVLAVSDAVQLGGNLAVGGLELLGFHERAEILQNSLEVVDLSGYVSDISDSVTDWIMNPQEPPDFSEFTERFSIFSCGI